MVGSYDAGTSLSSVVVSWSCDCADVKVRLIPIMIAQYVASNDAVILNGTCDVKHPPFAQEIFDVGTPAVNSLDY